MHYCTNISSSLIKKWRASKYKAVSLFIVVWASVLLGSILYLSNLRVGLFDPNNQLTLLSAQASFEREFVKKLQSAGIDTRNTTLHFAADKRCYCQTVAKPHIDSVKQLATEQGFINSQLTVRSDSALISYIPSTPAVAVFNQQGLLVYLGPYATGLFCAPQQGIFENYISSEQAYLGATIISDAKGCYCHS